MKSKYISVILSPFGLGGGIENNAEHGPNTLVGAGLLQALGTEGHLVKKVDLGDVYPWRLGPKLILRPKTRKGASVNHLTEVVHAVRCLEDEATKVFERGERVLSIGGDHSVAIGTGRALLCYARMRGLRAGVVWIDQHMDGHTPETSPSKNAHGMPLAVLLGYGHPRLVRASTHGGLRFAPENVLLIGPSSYESGEEELFSRLGLRVVTMREFLQNGHLGLIRAVEEIERLAARVDILFVSVDLDAFDGAIVCDVQYPAKRGLFPGEGISLVAACARTGKVVAGEVVECASREEKHTASTVRVAIACATTLMREHARADLDR